MRGAAIHPIVLAAGGTGGHFFPAEALAAELSRRGHRIALLTDSRGAAKLPPAFQGRDVHVVGGAGIAGRGMRRQAAAAAGIALGVLQARAAMARLQPAALVGFGGYPVVAPVLATRLLAKRPPVILHDQNAVLGGANRAMARFATVLALSFGQVSRVPPGIACVTTGNPVRPEFTAAAKADDGGIRILVLGGSLGARALSDTVPAALAALPEALRLRLHVAQQCRAEDLDRVAAAYRAAAIPAETAAFFTDVPARMAAAALFIGRAGGSTVAELALSGTPAVLIPLPIAVNDEQGGNAAALAKAGAAWVVRQPDLTVAHLRDLLASLLADPTVLTRAGTAAHAVGRPAAAAALADLVLAHAGVAA